MDNELMQKAKQASSAEELLAIAKENGMDLSEEEAQAYFAQLHKSGELADEELDSVAGGGCYRKDGRLVLSLGAMSSKCDYWHCKLCGSKIIAGNGACKGCQCVPLCKFCIYYAYDKGLWICTNENTRRWG